MENEVVKKPKKKYFILGAIGIIVLVTLIVVLSTYGRWINEKESLNRVLVNKYDDMIVYTDDKDIIQINSIKDFYGDEYKLELNDNEYAHLYCNKNNDCIYMEDSFFQHPGILIFICVFVLIVIVYLIIKDLAIINIVIKAVLASVILATGLVLIFMETYEMLDYYGMVNNNNNLVEGKVVGYISNGKKYNEVIEYFIDDYKYIYVNNSTVKTYELDKDINVYYDKKVYSIAEVKRNPLIINNYVYGLLFVIESIFYFRLLKKDK